MFRNPDYYTKAVEIDTTGLNERQKKAKSIEGFSGTGYEKWHAGNVGFHAMNMGFHAGNEYGDAHATHLGKISCHGFGKFHMVGVFGLKGFPCIANGKFHATGLGNGFSVFSAGFSFFQWRAVQMFLPLMFYFPCNAFGKCRVNLEKWVALTTNIFHQF